MNRTNAQRDGKATTRQSQALVSGLSIVCLVFASPLTAQHVPEADPRPGEQRLNRFQFHATHNSYERDNGLQPPFVSIADQLDIYDAWMIELDLTWNIETSEFWIFHASGDDYPKCADWAGNGALNVYLSQIKATHRASHGVTFLYFDGGEEGPCPLFPHIGSKPPDWKELLWEELKSDFGSPHLYTPNDFEGTDGSTWPSPQELVRRGKHFITIINGSGTTALFGSSKIIFINTDKEVQPITAADLGDTKFARHYPFGWWCLSDNGWDWAVNNNYSFPASNCSDKTNPRFHPPLRTYVAFPQMSDGGRGTWGDIYRGPNGFKNAMSRILEHQNLKGPSRIEVQMGAGTYSAPARISAAVRLTSAGGTVRLLP